MTTSTGPAPPPGNGNPLVGLAIAVIRALLYVLDRIKALITWVTITVPSLLVRILQYSFTISLGFPHLLGLFIVALLALTFLIRYRYLTRYTQLKEPALPPPSPQALSTDLLPQTDRALTENRKSSSTFHNYLDDFLSAIRIFGYLEKPVFHELSRHLQTRRLAAGETLEIGGGDFWCVVDGKVQVFAPSSDVDLPSMPSSNPGSPRSFNGYHLLNEVSTGGTLSSLFSILTLFTEDIKLSWTPPPEPESDGEDDSFELPNGPLSLDDHTFGLGSEPSLRRNKSRANSDVSQLGEDTLGRRMDSPSNLAPDEKHDPAQTSDALQSGVAELGAEVKPKHLSSSLPGTKSPSPVLEATIPHPETHETKSAPASPPLRGTRTSTTRPAASRASSKPSSERRKKSAPRHANAGATAFKGTIARATVDTTLAVIPAEAFKKLTRKFPKASGTVVQVVLERFSRVTFMTAHKYLGLTREILKSESSLNKLVSHPLPPDFYTGGGMNALRSKFQPDYGKHRSEGNTMPGTPGDLPTRVNSRDYFNYVPPSPTVRAPSLPSVTPRKAMSPFDSIEEPASIDRNIDDLPKLDLSDAKRPSTNLSIATAAAQAFSPDTAARHSSKFVRRTSAMRKQVAAGDLAMSHISVNEENGGAYYRPGAQTPGFPRMETWRGRPGSAFDWKDQKDQDGIPISPNFDESDTAELRDLVLMSIAKSIGLAQPETQFDSNGRSSIAPSTSALSTPNSPMFPPNTRNSRSPFGNVLDMMNASSHNDSMIGGLLREAVMHAQHGDDDMSSISASMHESMAAGQDMTRGILRDLEGKVEILFFKKGSTLVKEGEKSPGIYYVIDGFLDVSVSHGSGGMQRGSAAKSTSTANNPDTAFSHAAARPFGAALGLDSSDEPKTAHLEPNHDGASDEQLFTVKPGGIAGYLASLCSTDSYVNITAKTDCFVGFLPAQALERILERRPIVLLTLAKRLLSLLSPLVLHIDAALDWMQLSGGQVLYEKGDRSSDFYIVINGRLRSLNEKDNAVEVLREYGQNDSIGELDVITAVPRSDTVHAIRDTELVRIPAALFDAVSTKHPATTVQFMRLIAARVRRAMGEQALQTGRDSGKVTPDVNLKTICILGTNRSVPVAQFAGKLKTSLEELGANTSYLDQGTVIRHLGRHAFARIGKLKVAGWLADQEQHYRTVLYVADTPPSSQWTLTCIRQADLVLILGMGDDPSLGEYEKLLLATKTTARKELILLHDERTVAPGSTRLWLKNRTWLHAHHHVELPGVITPSKATPTVHDPAALAAFKHLRERVETRIKRYRGLRPLRPRRPPYMNDFARIARRLIGKQIGLVLGGGGARGISHIGFIQALEEQGIPIDGISGCSIGSFVGGLYARETDLLETTGRTQQFSGRMGSMWRILSDVTYPYVSYTTGHEFNRGIYKAFYNTHIEDFWIPFFANSTNITHSRMEVHRSGYAWRYVRASMTLAGLLPPLSDNGNLLVDGGYMDNTPVGPLRTSGIRDVIVVDVGAIDDTSPRNYGDSVSGWWIFLNKFNPFYEKKVLSMTEISSRLAYVSSVKTLEDVKTDPHCLYVAMPVQQFDTLGGFKRFSEVLAVGLKAGRETLKQWKEEGKLPSSLGDDPLSHEVLTKGTRMRRMSI